MLKDRGIANSAIANEAADMLAALCDVEEYQFIGDPSKHLWWSEDGEPQFVTVEEKAPEDWFAQAAYYWMKNESYAEQFFTHSSP